MKTFSITDFEAHFPNDDTCLDWLLKARWPDGVPCKRCAIVTTHHRLTGRPAYTCGVCGSHTYPMAGTIFQDSRTPLRLWFKAIAMMAVTRCGISSRQLSRDLGVTIKTGYRMWFQIRQILVENHTALLGIVEADETYVGGAAKNKHANKRDGKRGRGASGKTIVMGMVQRKGRVVAMVVPDVSRATILPKIQTNVQSQTKVYTDEMPTYTPLAKMGYQHGRVNHLAKLYVTSGDIHTNTIEGFWSQLKRSIDGTYHHVTAQHLQEYVNEYAFRYSHRNDEQPMFWTMLNQVVKHSF